MSDHMSVFFATTLLALGGLGLYMLKSDDEPVDNEPHSEEGFFDQFSLGDWFKAEDTDEKKDKKRVYEEEQGDDEEDDEEPVMPRAKKQSKTQKNRKTSRRN